MLGQRAAGGWLVSQCRCPRAAVADDDDHAGQLTRSPPKRGRSPIVEEVARFATAALARQDDRARQRRGSLGRLTAIPHQEDCGLAGAAVPAHGAGLDLGRRHVVLRAQPAEAGNGTPGELAQQVPPSGSPTWGRTP